MRIEEKVETEIGTLILFWPLSTRDEMQILFVRRQMCIGDEGAVEVYRAQQHLYRLLHLEGQIEEKTPLQPAQYLTRERFTPVHNPASVN